MRRLLGAVLVALTLAACGDSTTGVGAGVAGTWNLQTVNAKPVPAVLVEIPGYKYEVVSGTLELQDNGSLTLSITDRTTEQASVDDDTQTSGGTYSVSGSTITINPTNMDAFSGTISGSTMTFVVSDTDPDTGATVSLTLVFKRS